MTNRPLFGSSSTGLGSTGGHKHLIEIRAGKMHLKNKKVYPDKRKGLIFLYQTDDSLMHFCWQDRTSATIEDDLIIFPDDCEYVRVPECTTGRAYLLKFKSSNKKFFFWLQEPKTDKDEDNCAKINEFLNNPASATQSNDRHEQDIHSILSSMSQSQLMHLFGGSGQVGGLSNLLGTIRERSGGSRASVPALTYRPLASSGTPPVSTSTEICNINLELKLAVCPSNLKISRRTIWQTSSMVQHHVTVKLYLTDLMSQLPSIHDHHPDRHTPDAPRKSNRRTTGEKRAATTVPNPIQLFDVQNFLEGITGKRKPGQPKQGVDMSTVLTTETLSGIIDNPEAVKQLQAHLPSVNESPEDALKSTLGSPQFQQAMSQFSQALESGQLGPVISQLDVSQDAVKAAKLGNMDGFIKALSDGNSDADKDKDSKENKNEKKDDDELMQLD